MKFFVDTCVISEQRRQRPDQTVIDWLNGIDPYFSILTVGELEKGARKLDDPARRDEVMAWIDEMKRRFAGRILPIGKLETDAWSALCAETESRGHPLPAIDSLIAATAIAHGLTVATRTVKDMLPAGVSIYNPFDQTWHNRDDETGEKA